MRGSKLEGNNALVLTGQLSYLFVFLLCTTSLLPARPWRTNIRWPLPSEVRTVYENNEEAKPITPVQSFV